MTHLTCRPGLVGAVFDRSSYIPQPMPLWQEPGSSERQRQQFAELCVGVTVLALTWPVAMIAWPMIGRGTR